MIQTSTRRNSIVDYLTSRADGQGCEFVCIVGRSFAASCTLDGKWLDFEKM